MNIQDEKRADELELLMFECEERSSLYRKCGLYEMAKVIDARCAEYNREHYLLCCGVKGDVC